MPNKYYKPAEHKAYQRGYHAGMRGYWPENRPTFPPHELVRAMFEAARKLRDAADNAIALEGGPEESLLEKEFGPHIEAIDAVSREITEWLKKDEQQSA